MCLLCMETVSGGALYVVSIHCCTYNSIHGDFIFHFEGDVTGCIREAPKTIAHVYASDREYAASNNAHAVSLVCRCFFSIAMLW